MQALESLIIEITQLPLAKRSRKQISVMKRKRAKKQRDKDLPTNIALFKTYKQLIETGILKEDKEIANLFKKRSIRSMSGIVPVQVLTKPFRCPGECIFCPNDASMPKSYINTQPGAMRALLNQFDPYKQTYNRLLSLTLTGHETDKIEMIVLGGTWDVYPKRYKIEFIKGLYDACNSFTEFLQKIDIDYTNKKAARFTKTEDFDIQYPETIKESIQINETADHRMIGLTIETRPEYVTDENCQFRRELGVTRIEMGVQTLHDDIHVANKRGHDNETIRQAMHKLRQYGFKISNHYMPGLYQSTIEKDIETFRLAWSSPWVKSDEIKFYPTAVIPNTELFELYKEGKYQSLTRASLEQIIRTVKTEIIPPYARIKRLARDFDTNEVVAGANTPNLRQLVMRDMMREFAEDKGLRREQYKRLATSDKQQAASKIGTKEGLLDEIQMSMNISKKRYHSLSKEEREIDDRVETYTVGGSFDTELERNFVCLCTRCREVRNKEDTSGKLQAKRSVDNNIPSIIPDIPFLIVRRYRSSVGEELFLSFEDSLGYLYGFTRLLLPDEGQTVDWVGLGEGTALIRELHVYGSLQSLQLKAKSGKLQAGKVQHSGFGRQLIEMAEDIVQLRGYQKLSIIAGVGVRKYYEEKLGYELEGTYMVKEIV